MRRAKSSKKSKPPDERAPVVDPNAPPATPPAVATPPAAAPAVIVPPAAPANEEPAWLAGRLERERQAMLRDLGVTSAADAKSALAAYKAEQDSKKTEEQRLRERVAQLEAEAAPLKSSRDMLLETHAAALSTLTEKQRADVLAIAGDDPASQIKTIRVMRERGLIGGAPPPPPPVAPPANTAPPAVSPPPATPNQGHLQKWEALKTSNPVKAAMYLGKFTREISAQRAERDNPKP